MSRRVMMLAACGFSRSIAEGWAILESPENCVQPVQCAQKRAKLDGLDALDALFPNLSLRLPTN